MPLKPFIGCKASLVRLFDNPSSNVKLKLWLFIWDGVLLSHPLIHTFQFGLQRDLDIFELHLMLSVTCKNPLQWCLFTTRACGLGSCCSLEVRCYYRIFWYSNFNFGLWKSARYLLASSKHQGMCWAMDVMINFFSEIDVCLGTKSNL